MAEELESTAELTEDWFTFIDCRLALSNLSLVDISQRIYQSDTYILKSQRVQNFKTTRRASMYRKILVTTDGSTLANKAVKSAIELASTLDAELIALKVIPRYLQTYFEGSIPLDNQQIMMLEKQWEDEAAEVLAKVEKQAEKSGLILTTSIVKANIISEAIITFAQKKKVDLIVMASHGRNGFKRLILGSETLQVLTHSYVPVLVLR